MGLLQFKANRFSQNGEDGILERIFDLIGAETKTCCEFGAWDGIHLSNTRKLLLEGWSGLLIEAHPRRFLTLRENYSTNPGVKCVNKMIRDAAELEAALAGNGFKDALDLLSIDIDGLDYYILEGLRIRPRVICVEVTSGHSPEAMAMLPREVAARGVGQPLIPFCRAADNLGYKLIGYNGNAFLLRNNITHAQLPELDPVAAYLEYEAASDKAERRWMYIVNKGLVPPYHRFENGYLTADVLGLGPADIGLATARGMMQPLRRLLHRGGTQCGAEPFIESLITLRK